MFNEFDEQWLLKWINDKTGVIAFDLSPDNFASRVRRGLSVNSGSTTAKDVVGVGF